MDKVVSNLKILYNSYIKSFMLKNLTKQLFREMIVFLKSSRSSLHLHTIKYYSTSFIILRRSKRF